jgi:hypothetical protein
VTLATTIKLQSQHSGRIKREVAHGSHQQKPRHVAGVFAVLIN